MWPFSWYRALTLSVSPPCWVMLWGILTRGWKDALPDLEYSVSKRWIKSTSYAYDKRKETKMLGIRHFGGYFYYQTQILWVVLLPNGNSFKKTKSLLVRSISTWLYTWFVPKVMYPPQNKDFIRKISELFYPSKYSICFQNFL